MVKKWAVRLVIAAFACSLVLVAKGGAGGLVRAVEMSPVAYFPLLTKSEMPRSESFSSAEMTWNVWLRDDTHPIDGEYYHEGGRLVAEMNDNRANFVAYPDWRPLGDFQIDADIRFRDGEWLNGVGVVFGGRIAEKAGRDQWIDYYAFLLGWNFKQHNWGFARVDDGDFNWLTKMGGAPATVRWFSDWNHITIVSRSTQRIAPVAGSAANTRMPPSASGCRPAAK